MGLPEHVLSTRAKCQRGKLQVSPLRQTMKPFGFGRDDSSFAGDSFGELLERVLLRSLLRGGGAHAEGLVDEVAG